MSVQFQNVSVLLPAIDETYSLSQTVDIIADTCNSEDIAEIIILLAKRSTPETFETAENIIKKYSGRLKIYIHEQVMPFVGGANREGISLAEGSHIIMMSSDLESDPHTAAELIRQSKIYPDRIITASRWKKGGGFKGYSKIKLICNYIFEKAIALFYFSDLTDITFGYRLFPSELVKNIRWEELKHPFFFETAVKPLRLGVKFIEIPSFWSSRTEGTSNNSFFANFKYFRTAWHNRFLKPEQILLNNESRNS